MYNSVRLDDDKGSLAATRWLHDLGPTSDIDPAEVLFVFLGNSGRRYGGIYNGNSDIGKLLGGVLGDEEPGVAGGLASAAFVWLAYF